MPIVSLRVALLATAFALPGVLLAQAPAPSATQAPAASVPPKGASAPTMSKSASPPATNAAKAPAAAPVAAPAAQASGDANATGGKKAKSSRSAAGATDAAGAANAAPASGGAPKSARAKEGAGGGKTVGMQRAFADLQTTGEFNAYRDKAQAVKTVDECRTLMEATKKQLEPRAKAQNKPINVDIDKACATAKERKGLAG